MFKQQFRCAVDSEERVWAINHLLPPANFSLIQAYVMGKSCTMRKGGRALMSRGNYLLPQLGLAVNHAPSVSDHFELHRFDLLELTGAPYVAIQHYWSVR